jgi:hypothetical protein
MGSSRQKKPKADAKAEGFTCEFCKKQYQQEKSFLVHMCAKKQRFLDRGEKYVKLGFWVYQRFHNLSYNHRKEKTFEDFANSQFYTSFTRFGRYLLNINAVNMQGFVDFLIKASIPIDEWQSPIVYETYVRELNKRESADAAVERNILLMEQWAVETGEHWTDFFRKIEPTLATAWIRSGRISPWVLYTASSASNLMQRMSEEQVELTRQALDPAFWGAKLETDTEEVDRIRAILDSAGV